MTLSVGCAADAAAACDVWTSCATRCTAAEQVVAAVRRAAAPATSVRSSREAASAVDRTRRMKPSIPLIGFHGIPIRDELTLVKNFDGADSAESGGVA